MTLTIYTTVGATTGGIDMTPYIAHGGVARQRADVESPDAGRTLDAKMHRSRIARKLRLDITCRPLTSAEAKIVLDAVEPEWIDVVYDDPHDGANSRKTVYSNNIPATIAMTKDGVDYWEGIVFPLIEQ